MKKVKKNAAAKVLFTKLYLHGILLLLGKIHFSAVLLKDSLFFDQKMSFFK